MEPFHRGTCTTAMHADGFRRDLGEDSMKAGIAGAEVETYSRPEQLRGRCALRELRRRGRIHIQTRILALGILIHVRSSPVSCFGNLFIGQVLSLSEENEVEM
ncbi:unnamed protein product [Symbiodinium sp. CCMP2592]|nr:unnamed protein product [Symbiodinium sp. CCMP2592]